MMTARSCGLGTILPSVDAVVVHDSDWNPRWDIQALSRARTLGAGPVLPVLRLYMHQTAEERILQLVSRRRGVDVILKPPPGRFVTQQALG